MIRVASHDFNVYENRWILAGTTIGLAVAAIAYAAFKRLGRARAEAESIRLEEGSFRETKRALYRKILIRNPLILCLKNNPSHRLAILSTAQSKEERQTLFILAIQCSSKTALYYKDLADTLATGECITLHDGVSMTKEQLMKKYSELAILATTQ